MPQIIIKAAPDRELYFIWSTIVDAPLYVFDSRTELVDHLTTHDKPQESPWLTGPEARVARADQKGSSALTPIGRCDWDDETLSVRETAPMDGWYHIRRDRLVDYAEALLRDDDAGAQALPECWMRNGEDDG